MAKKKINTTELLTKIERITKARMASEPVVELNSFRDLKKKMDPKVILIIEDDETMRNALKRIFEAESYVVRLASDGTELTTVLDDVPPDLIILDVGLPWMNGLELGQLMKDHKDLKKIPLIFVTGQSSDAEMKAAFEIGADEFIRKPFEIEGLRKTVENLLRRDSI
jgi:two-component system, OmpR family, aerobic respiration control protein ArcA